MFSDFLLRFQQTFEDPDVVVQAALIDRIELLFLAEKRSDPLPLVEAGFDQVGWRFRAGALQTGTGEGSVVISDVHRYLILHHHALTADS